MMPIPSAKFTSYMTTCGFDGVVGQAWRLKTGFPPLTDTIPTTNAADLFFQITNTIPDPQKPVFTGFTCVCDYYYRNGARAYSEVKGVLDRVEAAFPGRYVFLLPKDKSATIRAYYDSVNLQQIEVQPGVTNGSSALAGEDGKFTITERDGVRCWLVAKPTTPNYFYLDADDRFRPKPGQTLEIELEYLDIGSGEVALEYDSTDIRATLGGAYKSYPYLLRRANTGRWQKARFLVNDAGFGGLQNMGADFRFCNRGDELPVRAVRVRRIGPKQ
jgi:hypothetical protein